MRKTLVLFLAFVGLMLFAATSLLAQATASGTIQGTVFDQTQAVIAGAEVMITSKATGEIRTGITTDVGTYRFDLLPTGSYTLKASKPGFSSLIANVDVLIGQLATANVTLTPG